MLTNLIGTLNIFIDLGVLNFLIALTSITVSLYYTLFKSISLLVAATNSYFWNKHWTFK
ncbi:MAG: GtrA family protein [Candidatus Nealsonbacteria bacterium]|nr:GtrA family protein [Candidatus Nealsonbacteria bacterium]